MTEHHDIPEWYIPDEEQVIANEHEKEEIEKKGQLEEPLCPHCSKPYEKEDEDYYIHGWKPVDGGNWEWEPTYNTFGEQTGWKRGGRGKAGVWCNPSGEKCYDDSESFGFQGQEF